MARDQAGKHGSPGVKTQTSPSGGHTGLQIRASIQEKVKDVLHLPSPQDDHVGGDLEATRELTSNPAFASAQLETPHSWTVRDTADSAVSGLVSATKAVANPKKTAKRKAAAKIAIEDRPYLSRQSDDEYHNAHIDMLDGSRRDTSASDSAEEAEEIESYAVRKRHQIQILDETREARKVAWTTARYIQRVVVVPTHASAPPNVRQFYTTRDTRKGQSFDRMAYYSARTRWSMKTFAIQSMGEIDSEPRRPFDRDICMRYFERIILATAPWQSWLLGLRALYRWENPRNTAKWAAIWFLIWYLDFVMTFVLAWTAFIVLRNRFTHKSTEELYRAYRSDVGDDGKARRLHELIRQHGHGEWLEPFLDEAGPLLQMQLADMADFLEVLVNFYEWTYPNKTWATLFWFATAVTIGATTATGYSMKIYWMFCLLAFFLSRPVASRHPQYRHVVNALKWIFWDIPTDADWSMTYLRSKARLMRNHLLEAQVERSLIEDGDDRPSESVSDAESVYETAQSSEYDQSSTTTGASIYPAGALRLSSTRPLLQYRAKYHNSRIHLHILPNGLRLAPRASSTSSATDDIFFRWHQIRELRKHDQPGAKHIRSQQAIDILIAPTANDSDLSAPLGHAPSDSPSSVLQTLRLASLSAQRDDVFNVILGFSGLRFQVLQPLSDAKAANVPDPNDDQSGRDARDDQDTADGHARIGGPIGKVSGKLRRGVEKGLGKVSRLARQDGHVSEPHHDRENGTDHDAVDGDEEFHDPYSPAGVETATTKAG